MRLEQFDLINACEDDGDVEPWMRTRCDDEAVVFDGNWIHRIVNPRAVSPTVGANVDGLDQR